MPYSRIILLLAALWIGASSALAQPVWRQLDGPYGGTIVSSLAMLDDGSVLAATAGGLFTSSDAGDTWQPDGNGVSVSGIDARALLVLPDGTVLAATFGGGVYRRAPDATQWASTGGWGQFTTSLARSPDGTLYAGTIQGLLRSIDGGYSWENFAIADRAVWVQAVAATEGHVVVGSREGIYRSADRALTWEFASMGMSTLDTTALLAARDGTLFAGTSSILPGCRLYRSRSEGRLWTCAQPSPDPLRIGAIAEDALGRIYVGGYRLIYHSDNGGDTWRNTPATNTTIHALASRNSMVMAGTFGRGVIRSDNRATTWTDSNEGLMSAVNDLVLTASGDLYVATIGGVFRTRDRGRSWSLMDPADQPVRSTRSVALDQQGRVLAGTLSGLYRYTPDTATWANLGPPGQPAIADLSVGPDGKVFAGYYEGVYELNGSQWRSHPIVGPDQATRNVVAVQVDQAGTLFAGASYDSFRRSPGEDEWRRLRSDVSPYFEASVFTQTADGRLLAGTRYFGVMESVDGGTSWTPMDGGLYGTEDIRAIALDANGDLYIGSFGRGVLQWQDRRNEWTPYDAGMEGTSRVTGLLFSPEGEAFASTYGGGVFVLDASSTEREPDFPVSDIAIDGPYPNPTSATSRLRMQVPATARVQIAAYDLLGRQVWTGSADGAEAVDVDLTDQPAGLYMVRVQVSAASGSWSRTVPLAVAR